MTKLKPCPFCHAELVSIAPEQQFHAVQCRCCSASGPLSGNPDQAARLWNTRTSEREAIAEVKRIDILRRNSRMLLRRLVRYVQKDAQLTPRLVRLLEQCDDYLNRTSEPSDYIRAGRFEGGET